MIAKGCPLPPLNRPLDGFDASPDALALVAKLHRAFEARRQELLAARVERTKRLDAGERPDFLPQTKTVRDGNWTIAPIPADLQSKATFALACPPEAVEFYTRIWTDLMK